MNKSLSNYEVSVCSNPQEWDSFVNKHTEHVYFFWRWKMLMEQVFPHESHYLKATDVNGQIAAVIPLFEVKSLLFGHYALSLPFVNYGGILSNSEEASFSVINYLENLGKTCDLSHILIRESTKKPTPWSSEEHKVSMLLQLPDDEETLWSALGSKLRAQVKRPIREGAKNRIGHVELLDDFYFVFSRNMRDLGTPVYSKKWFLYLLEAFPKETYLAVVYLDNKPAAAGFLIQHGGQMEIPWASSLREYNRLGVNMMLYWEALKCSISKSCTMFDFGRSSKDANTYRFKKQWGSEPHQLYWYNWTSNGDPMPQLDPSNSKYAKAIEIWKKLPVPIANFFGPGIVRYLP